MKKICLYLLSACCISTNGIAQNDVYDWENPQVFAINKEETRATAIPYPTENSAIIDDYTVSPFYQSLNGTWKFFWAPKPSGIPDGFYEEGYNVTNWANMPVPGNWEFNGFGIPMYVNIGFGIPKNAPYIDKEDAPVGAYRHQFIIPENWSGRRVFLHFEGGTNAMYVWVNGKKVGYTENAKSPAEFDITEFIRKGNNTLACEAMSLT